MVSLWALLKARNSVLMKAAKMVDLKELMRAVRMVDQKVLSSVRSMGKCLVLLMVY